MNPHHIVIEKIFNFYKPTHWEEVYTRRKNIIIKENIIFRFNNFKNSIYYMIKKSEHPWDAIPEIIVTKKKTTHGVRSMFQFQVVPFYDHPVIVNDLVAEMFNP